MSDDTQQPHGAISVATGDGRWRMVVLPAHGGVLARLQVRSREGEDYRDLVAGPDLAQPEFRNPFYQGVPLYPFVNRLRDGCWTFHDKAFRFPLNEAARHNSLHGFLYRRAMTVTDAWQSPHEAQLALQFDYTGDEAGYPFKALVELRYHLHSVEGLCLTMGVTNHHSAPVPVGVGWHPYLSLGLPVDDLYLHLPPCERIEVDERLLPTGESQRFDKFREPTRIDAWQVDHCFRLLQASRRSVCRIRESHAPGAFGLELWQDSEEFPWMQIYIPPDRGSIAIEPVSCGIDALNSGEGLRWLAPGERLTASCGISLL